MAEEKSPYYHAMGRRPFWKPLDSFLETASDEDLGKWAMDANCLEAEACAKLLAARVAERERLAAKRQAKKEAVLAALKVRRDELRNYPFDPRTEISADARHIAGRIVTHLWVIFVLFPFVIAILLGIAGVIK